MEQFVSDQVISIKNLTFSYENAPRPAVTNLSLEVRRGDYLAIVGTNGSGKSTLSKLIAGYLPLQEGMIEIRDSKNLIGFVQQNPKYQIIASIVEKDTALGPELQKHGPKEVERRVLNSLSAVDLMEKRREKTGSLSLGQTQKLALAGILALEPDIMILDEAVSMIDPDTRENILEIVDKLHESGKTIIHITHDIDEVKKANRVVVMEKSEKVFDGSKEEFLKEKDIFEKLFGAMNSPVYLRSKNSEDKQAPLALAFENIDFSYKKEEKALDNINLAFKKGTITAVLGKSGSGKSTLFELGTSLLAPSQGKIYCEGKTSLAFQDAESALF
nr:ABC transporter ATP-binding protein [Treponemataceae bacterium]